MTIKVTKQQQEAVEHSKKDDQSLRMTTELKEFEKYELKEWAVPLKGMSDEQIAAAWLGVAEVEPEPVEPWEAYKAFWEGKTIKTDINKMYNINQNADEQKLFNTQSINGTNRKFYILEDE